MPDFTGGYTSAVNDANFRRERDANTQRMLEELTENRIKFQQQQQERARLPKELADLFQLFQQGQDTSSDQPPSPGQPSVPMGPPQGAPMMPAGQQPGPANVQTAPLPPQMIPQGRPIGGAPQMPGAPPGAPPGGTLRANAPDAATAIALLKILNSAGKEGIINAPAAGGQPPQGQQQPPGQSQAAPPPVGYTPMPGGQFDQRPQAPPMGGSYNAIGAPPIGVGEDQRAIQPAKTIDPQELGKRLVKQGATPLQAAQTIIDMWPMIQQQNKNAIEDFKAQALIAQRVIDFRERQMRDDETRRYHRELEQAREKRLEQADRRQDFMETGGTGAARDAAAGPKKGAGGLSPEGLKLAAQQYRLTGKMPTLGFAGKMDREAIINEAARQEAEESGGDVSNVPGKQSEFHADSLALNSITKDLTAIKPFADMLDKNAVILKNLSANVVKTDNRYANRSLNWLSQNVTGDADMAEFLAQTRFVVTEAARVLNNPRLVGQLTDTARKEMEGVLDGTLSLDQTNRVIDRIIQDSKNRVGAMEKQRDALAKKLRGGSDESSTTHVAQPSAENAKGWKLMVDKNGNRAYVSPDKKQFEAVQ